MANMKFTRRGIFGLFIGAVVGAKAAPLVKSIPGGAALKYPTPIKIQLQRVPIVVRPRKLKATWTMEAAQDLKSFHGIDAECELINAMSTEMTREIDEAIIHRLRNPTWTDRIRNFLFAA